MKITIKVKNVIVKFDDNNNDSFSKFDTRVEHVIKTIKVMTEEALKLYKNKNDKK